VLPETAGLSRALFLLADKAVWIIRPGETVVQRLTPPELKVTCFDIWSGDNRIAYGTDTGQVYLVRDTSPEDLTSLLEGEPLMLFDAFPDAPYLVRMDSLSWAPDGRRLAFTVDYSTPGAALTAGYPSSPSGLWLFELSNRQATWIESNLYLGPNQSDPNLVRRLTASRWSPDSSGLLVQSISREGNDILILNIQDPPGLLVNPSGELWGSISWRSNSQAILLSGRQNSLTSNLLQVQRDGSDPLVLVDGEQDELYVYDAAELPYGTAFLARCASCTSDQTLLYIGHRAGNRLVYTEANIRQYCQSGDARHIEWDTTGQSGALDCGAGELRALLFQVDNFAELDLSNYLRPLGGAEVLKLAWGGD
jgi:dipeptidyl aminopeptidase/acylaminoacyl peptidase